MRALPKCKLCRREGEKLFLKGERCNTQKCAMIKRKYPPGMHGAKGYPRLSEYGRQLRAKQRLKRYYSVMETHLRNYYEQARKQGGNTEHNLLKLLEKRLDNVVYRAGFGSSRRAARQLVNHGLVKINQRRLDIPSYHVRIGDLITLKDNKNLKEIIEQTIRQKKVAENLPSWLSLDAQKLEIKILQDPLVESLPQDFDTKLIVEFYSK